MIRRMLFIAMCGVLAACQPAHQYPAIGKKAEVKEDDKPDPDKDLHKMAWVRPTEEVHDVPIVFVADTSAEWSQLPAYWNHFPPGPVFLGMAPMEGLAAVVMSEHHRVIKIKVPRGLPDPTENIPLANRPTQGQWRLGKELFHTPFLKVDGKLYSCNTCHDSRRSFTSGPSSSTGTRFNTQSLINVVYNRRQFWDGRVRTLEETMFQSADDERAMDAEKRLEKGLKHHVWGGFVRAIEKEKRHDEQFRTVFGIERPTQDAAARAIAAYMRTLLSGDSIYNRAEAVRREKKDVKLSAAHFAAVLANENVAAQLRDSIASKTPTRGELPAMLMNGHELFHGRARCARCHTGPLFTDQDFHNIGFDKEESWPLAEKETGRALRVPIGAKETRLVGAFRTPTLRNLIGTSPYFHDGSRKTLADVIEFYDRGVLPESPYVASALKDGIVPQNLRLTTEEKQALLIYLRALQGQPMEPMLIEP